MRYLALIAHGSRREASNDEVRRLAQALERRAGDTLGGVRCGFLELAEPSIPDVIGHCVEAGASEVLVMPYFLSAGRHVAEDVPREVAIATKRYPGISIDVMEYLGADAGLLELMLAAVHRRQSTPA
ncbi:sirohydrochlorin ferrochelatase [Natronocella acetinitrilica]|uniref:Sirohydrochlorin ferrochelatase n=1 Tax=Natronocella acetinitrilica TaxID=414046 RepID=A0AAE3KCH9_9GAMM|nr:CbiX/SirB N-terminal domain-containing protein [Natronocella acetinitrilica]MCP1674973.1 sirohydrochlorin ferrochelatase [Natronocella acetinitrilica]